MYDEKLEQLIDAALADGELTEKEKQVLFKKAQALGVDLDEFEMVLDARLVKSQKAEQEKAASSAPKSNKFGDVKKCPACGALVQSYQGVCPECGYAFEGVGANEAVKELSSLLQKESNTEKLQQIIDSFPIPLDKASLLSFITWVRPQSLDTKNPLASSYRKKYSECVNKIKISFANDKELTPFIAMFADDEKKLKRNKILKNKFFWIGLIIVLIGLIDLFPKPIHKSYRKSASAIETALKNGDSQKATDILFAYKGDGLFEDKADEIIDACLKEGNINDAMKIGEKVGMKFGSDLSIYKRGADLAQKLYDYCISHGDFDNAKTISQSDVNYRYRFNGTYIKDVVTYLCKQGKKSEAQTFLNQNINIVEEHDKLAKCEHKDGKGSFAEQDRTCVKKFIQDIIDLY